MHRHETPLVMAGERLAFLDLVADPNQQVAYRARVLAYRDDELGRQTGVHHRGETGLVFVLGRVNAAVKIPQSAGFDAFE